MPRQFVYSVGYWGGWGQWHFASTNLRPTCLENGFLWGLALTVMWLGFSAICHGNYTTYGIGIVRKMFVSMHVSVKRCADWSIWTFSSGALRNLPNVKFAICWFYMHLTSRCLKCVPFFVKYIDTRYKWVWMVLVSRDIEIVNQRISDECIRGEIVTCPFVL